VSRGTRAEAVGDDDLIVHANPFAVLAIEAQVEATSAPWRQKADLRERLHRVMHELRWHRIRTEARAPEQAPDILAVDDAESAKAVLAAHVPDTPAGYGDLTSPASPLWDRISLTRLRFQGAKAWYAVLRSINGAHRLLVLKVPPRDFPDDAARWDHAQRQATYRDDRFGRFLPGLRVHWEAWEADAEPEDRPWLRSMGTGGGAPIRLTAVPPSYFRGENYPSHMELPDRATQDFHAMLARGAIEGPLHYRPWVVNPMGAVYLPEKDKFRTIHDCTASGLNGHVLPDECRYDMLEDALPLQTPSCWQAGWDLTDAFYHQHRLQEHCDLLGVFFEGEFYRFRFSPFGCSDCPALQQQFSTVLKRTANRVGRLRGPHRGWPDVTTTAVFMDDGHEVAPASLSQEEATQQFVRKMDYLAELGISESAKKRVTPTKIKSYTGFLVDSVHQTVTAEPKKLSKYSDSLDDLKASCTPAGEVSRKDLARVIGRYQHLAPILQGAQQLLTAAYRARDNAPTSRCRPLDWDDTTPVVMTPQAWQDLELTRSLLSAASRQYYLDGLPSENGFFKGHTEKTLDELLTSYTAHANIPVYVTDAAGTAGGGHRHDDRFIKAYPPDLCAPVASSNLREFDTGVEGYLRYQQREDWREQRALWLTDNTTAMSIVNREGTMAPALEGLSRRLQHHLRQHGVNLKARHIAGKLNTLADGLSRHEWPHTTADWMLADRAFHQAQSRVRDNFTLDGAADPLGTNSHLPRYCSVVDSFMGRNLAGEHVFANPDFTLIDDYLMHFKAEQQRSPYDTSLTLVVPAWLTAPWWKRLRGGHLICLYPQGAPLFTSPEWRTQQPSQAPTARVYRGPTRWPTLIVHFPTLMACRSVGRDGGLRPGHGHAAPHRAVQTLLILRGEPASDAALLRDVPQVSLC